MAKMKEDGRPMGSPRSWAATYGTHLAGQAAIDGADHAAIEAERKWGAGRLRLLVGVELREKFDRQRFQFNAAIWHGDLAEVQEQSRRMIIAWRVLDKAAEDAGASVLSPEVWEAAAPDGSVMAVVRTTEDAHAVVAQGRYVVVFTMEELAIMVSNYRQVVEVKAVFPGAEVQAIRRTINDPLDGFRDGRRLEDTLNDDMPAFGH